MKLFTTSNLEKVHSSCSDALLRAKINCVVGESGQGRTVALRSFTTTNSSHVIYVRFGRHKTVKRLLADIFLELREPVPVECDDLFQLNEKLTSAIRRHSSYCNGGLLIIIDDFEPKKDLLEAVLTVYANCFYKSIGEGVGFLLMIKPNDLIKVQNASKCDMLFKKFFHVLRCHGITKLSTIRKDEVKDICVAWGISDTETITGLVEECKTIDSVQRRINTFLKSQL
jgi:hypothetical protein